MREMDVQECVALPSEWRNTKGLSAARNKRMRMKHFDRCARIVFDGRVGQYRPWDLAAESKSQFRGTNLLRSNQILTKSFMAKSRIASVFLFGSHMKSPADDGAALFRAHLLLLKNAVLFLVRYVSMRKRQNPKTKKRPQTPILLQNRLH